MPLVAGLPRGTWSSSLDNGGKWSWEAEFDGSFAELVAAAVHCLRPIAAVRAVSWGSVSNGEDAITATSSDTRRLTGFDVEQLCPPDPSFGDIRLDLTVRSSDGTTRTIAGGGTFWFDNYDAQPYHDRSGVFLYLVLHNDVFCPATNGLLGDNRAMASRNAPHLAKALDALTALVGNQSRLSPDHNFLTVSGYKSIEFFERNGYLSQGREASIQLTAPALGFQEIGTVHAELRRRRHKYLTALRDEWYPASDSELLAAGTGTVAELAALATKLGIPAWATARTGAIQLANWSDLPYGQTNHAETGATTLQSLLRDKCRVKDSLVEYAEVISTIARDPLLFGYLLTPVLEQAPPLDDLFRLWAGGGSVVITDECVILARMWQ